jgi:FAD/FMN-containing dehydrogenase
MIAEKFCELIDRKVVIRGADIEERYRISPTGRYSDAPLYLAKPASLEEVVSLVALAREERLSIVPIGGGTGTVGGTVADGAIKLSLERLNKIHEIDTDQLTLTVDAGVTLQAAQEAVEQQGLFLPLDIGSRGSATIGGTIATNAGGNRVLRWGMARDMVLGLEAVTADGAVLSSLTKFVKDNTGYDWKQLMIGSEGTLGIITRAVLRLRPQPLSSSTALIAVGDFPAAVKVMRHLEQELSGNLSSFELMWNDYYRWSTEAQLNRRSRPLPESYPLYCIAESLGSKPDRDPQDFEEILSRLIEEGLIVDAVIAKSAQESESIWAVREDILPAIIGLKSPVAFYDISMPLARVPQFNEEAEANIRKVYPDAHLFFYGHAGDGNMHLVASPGEDDPDYHHKLDVAVYRAVQSVEGSISGEHGIGIAKLEFLPWYKSAAEIEFMRKIKSALDPTNLLNPGKIF